MKDKLKSMFELSPEVEETIHRIDLDPHVIGSMVLNKDGSVLKTTVDSTMTSQVYTINEHHRSSKRPFK